jgi:hypothetical protein
MNDKEKIEKAVSLLEELIEVAEVKDKKHKEEAIAKGNAEQAIGTSYDIFYLKMVKNVLEGKE